MSNVFKYSVGATAPGCLYKGGFMVGNNTADYGGTFYAGITPGSSGYTVLLNKASGGPSIYTPSSDASLVTLTNTQIAGTVASPTSYTTAAECLTYFAGQTDKVCVNRDYEGIVTSGLVLIVDAGYTPSYPTSGSSWYDLSGNGKNATLFNSPSFSSTSGGFLIFSKTSSNYATCSNVGTLLNWTAEVWVRFNSSLTGQVSMVLGNQFNLSTSINFTIGTNSAPSSYNIVVGFFESGWYNTTGFAPTLNTWYQIVGTYDGTTIRQYVNGAANGGTLTVSKTLQSGGEVRMMRRWDDVVSSGNLFDGNLAISRLYNRALSETEILQNYNIQKARFGL